MKHHQVNREALCPSCGMRSDGATHPYDNDVAPVPGDLSICVNCCAVLAFTDDMTVRQYADDELRALPVFIRLQLEGLRQFIARSASHAQRKH